MKFLGPLLIILLGLAGCSSLDTQSSPKANLAAYQRIFVETRLNDNNGVDIRIARALSQLGYTASRGYLTEIPDDSELVVTYDTRSAWDFREYLIELQISVRPVDGYTVLSAGRHFHPGITNKTPDTLVHELVGKIFPPAKSK